MNKERKLRQIIREAVSSIHFSEKSSLRNLVRSAINEEDDKKVTNAELTKGLKTGAAEIAKEIPMKFNDDWVDAMNSLKDMAQFDKAKFVKVTGLIDKYGQLAAEKAKKNEKPADEKEDPVASAPESEEGADESSPEFKGF